MTDIYNIAMNGDVLPAQCTGFEWDEGNSEKNFLKHGVLPSECEQMFFNQPLVVTNDVTHSNREKPFFALGQTGAGRLLFIAFTLRGTLIRVISARDMNRKERKVYQEL